MKGRIPLGLWLINICTEFPHGVLVIQVESQKIHCSVNKRRPINKFVEVRGSPGRIRGFNYLSSE